MDKRTAVAEQVMEMQAPEFECQVYCILFIGGCGGVAGCGGQHWYNRTCDNCNGAWCMYCM